MSEDDAIDCVPQSLYMFLCLLLGGQEVLEDDEQKDETFLQSRVLSIVQDIVYSVSGGQKWTPKHVGLGSTLHQATRSKRLLELFQRA